MSNNFEAWIRRCNFGFTPEDIENMCFGTFDGGYTWEYDIHYWGRHRDRLYQLNGRVTSALKQRGNKWKWVNPQYDDSGNCVAAGRWQIYINQNQAQPAPKPEADSAYQAGYQAAMKEMAETRREQAKKAAEARWTRKREQQELERNPYAN